MPAMANITVKKNDGTTDITYNVVAASGGDASPALWKVAIGTVPAFRASYSMKSEWNGPKTARRLLTEYRYPVTVTDGAGKQSISDTMVLTVTGTIPQGMTDTDINEACAQSLNLLAATLTKDSFKSGYAPV